MKKSIFIPLFSLLLTATLSFSQNSENVDLVVDKVQRKYENINDFHAQFLQEAEVKALKTVQKAHGEVWFKKPGKMRWNYYSPSKDTIVSDGKILWYYNDDEKQVMQSSLDQLSGDSSSTTLLSGLGKIKELFDVKIIEDSGLRKANSHLLELTSKDLNGNENSNRIIISVDKNSTLVNTIYLFDPFGNQTKITLDNLKINKEISDKKFKFKAPKGIEIVKMPSLK